MNPAATRCRFLFQKINAGCKGPFAHPPSAVVLWCDRSSDGGESPRTHLGGFTVVLISPTNTPGESSEAASPKDTANVAHATCVAITGVPVTARPSHCAAGAGAAELQPLPAKALPAPGHAACAPQTPPGWPAASRRAPGSTAQRPAPQHACLLHAVSPGI